jgi:hypothetical protein
MTPRNAIRSVGFGGVALAAALLISTGSIASSLGVIVPITATGGAGDAGSMTFWYQLSFLRLFATGLGGLGVILLWCQARLSPLEQRSLVIVLAGVLAALSLMAAGQQVAVWTTNTGWVLVGALVLGTLGCATAALRHAGQPT